jgi:FtsH-binding integral membrane protein
MWETILKVVTVYFTAMVKFIFGPLGGFAAGLNLVVTILTTVASMMTVVIVFSFFGEFIKRRLLRRFFSQKKFSDRNRKYVWIWRRYGLAGIALLTPILLTPIGGTLLAISFGATRNKLILSMFVSAAAWGVILSMAVYFFGKEVFPDFVK